MTDNLRDLADQIGEPMTRKRAIEKLERLSSLDFGGERWALEMAIAALRREGELLDTLRKKDCTISDEFESWCFYCEASDPNYKPLKHKPGCIWVDMISKSQQPPREQDAP